jgi:hypothetical protein
MEGQNGILDFTHHPALRPDWIHHLQNLQESCSWRIGIKHGDQKRRQGLRRKRKES